MGFGKIKFRKAIISLPSRISSVGPAALPPRLIMFISFAGMSVINYAFGLAAGWLLAPGDFGLLAFTQTLLTIAGLALNSGFAWSLTADLVGADAAYRARSVRGAAIANLLLALSMSVAVLALFVAGPLRAGLENWRVVALVSVAFPLLSLVTISRATSQGTENFAMLAALFLVETGVKAVAGLGLVAMGFGAMGAIAGFLVGSLCASALGLVHLVRRLGIRPWGAITRPHFRNAGTMFAALLGMALLLNLDTIGLKLFYPADRAGRALPGGYRPGQHPLLLVDGHHPDFLYAGCAPQADWQDCAARRRNPALGANCAAAS